MWRLIAIGGAAGAARISWPIIRPKVIGFLGEAKVRHALRSFQATGCAVEHDILIKGGRDTTQIDHILISHHGIFVIETKNYSGYIYGEEGLRNWTQTSKKGYQHTFLNPLLQNKTHVRAVKALLHQYPDLPIYSIVAFGNKCSMPYIPDVVKISDLKLAIEARCFGPPVLGIEEIMDIKDILHSAAIKGHSARKKHDARARLAADASRHVTPEMMADFADNAKTAIPIRFDSPLQSEPCHTPEQIALTDAGAFLTIGKRTASIETFFETAKRDTAGKLVPKGSDFDHFICPYTGDSFPSSEAKHLYHGLWVAYLNKNPALVEYLHSHSSERPGNTYRCQTLLAAYEKDPAAFTAQARNCDWYRNVVCKLQQRKRPLGDQIHHANADSKSGKKKDPTHASHTR